MQDKEADKSSAGRESTADQLLATFADRLHRERPKQIGPYRLLHEIGEGGMGVVFKAEQKEPVHRIVALKLIKLGMGSKEAVTRFEIERQALRLLDHPGVAKVFDGGVTDDGRPYLAMEYVAGEPLHVFCDDYCLPLRRRLELFAQVCDAVNHAHQKGVIHRDLKPGNVLVCEVNGTHVPKVIDFGIAKAAAGTQLTDRTMVTHIGQVIGTPEYMSPEQAGIGPGALDIDTRSDVYSLGVILYELLTGALPFDRSQSSPSDLLEVQRVLREVEPPTPSRRLTSLSGDEARERARRRQFDVIGLTGALRRELEWIPIKAMRKDRAERYSSAAELAGDVRNYLAGRPLTAAPESARYRARKFIARHRGAVAAATAVTLALLAGLVGTTWQAHVASVQRHEAERQRAFSEATSEYLIGMFQGADPAYMRGRDVSAVELVNRAVAQLDRRLDHDPRVRANLQSNLANVLWKLGKSQDAEPILRRALSELSPTASENDALVQEMTHNLGSVLESLGRGAEAEPMLRKLLDTRRRTLGSDDPLTLRTLNLLGHIVYTLGRSRKAEPLISEALERRRRVLGPEHLDTLTSIAFLAEVRWQLGERTEAERLHRTALEGRQNALGEDHPDTLRSRDGLAMALRSLRRADEAEPLLRKNLELCGRILGDAHPQTLVTMNNLAAVLKDLKRLDEAEQLYRVVLDRTRHDRGPAHPHTLGAMNNLASVLSRQRRYADAEPLFRESLNEARRTLGDEHPQTISTMGNLASALHALENVDEAESLLQKTVELSRRSMGSKHIDTLWWEKSLAIIKKQRGRLNEAEALYRNIYEILKAERGTDDAGTRQSADELADCLRAMGRHAEADKLLPATTTSGGG